MANLTFANPTDASPLTAFAASAPGGDKFINVNKAKPVVIIFNNGHSSSITVTVAGVAKTINAGAGIGTGTFTRASRAAAITNALVGAMIIPVTELTGYVNDANELSLAYTGGNAALTVLGFQP